MIGRDAFGLAFVARLLLILATSVCLLASQGQALGSWLAPWFARQVQAMDDNYQVRSLALERLAGERVFALEVSQSRCIVLRQRVHCPHPLGRARASTLMGHLMLTTAVMCAVTLAWPLRRQGRASPREALGVTMWRVAWLSCAVPLVWALDVPMVLWAQIWRLHVDALAPGMQTPLLIWADFLASGGRIALALALAVPCAWVTMRRERQAAPDLPPQADQ